MKSNTCPLWVVTSYYNPAGYRRRLENFRAFSRLLNAPLLVVELAAEGKHQLDSGCCDRLIQLTGESHIWQKERLLNIGIEALPPHVQYVAWIDCDVAFENNRWVAETIGHLETHGGLLQLFENVIHCPEHHHPERQDSLSSLDKDCLYTERSGASAAAQGNYVLPDSIFRRAAGALHSKSTGNPPESPGHAWAARVAEVRQARIYDGNIIGGGDSVLFHSAAGTLEASIQRRIYSSAHATHVRQWRASAESAGLLNRLAFLDGTLIHFWHGDFAHRQYQQRHRILFDAGYDPEVDIRLAPNLTWQWTQAGSRLAQRLRSYFLARNEDGMPPSINETRITL